MEFSCPLSVIATQRHKPAREAFAKLMRRQPTQYLQAMPNRNVWLFWMAGRNTG